MLKSLPETMFWEVVSVSPIPMREIALRAASVLDDAGDLAPDRGAFSAQTRSLDAGGLRGMIAGATGKQVRNGLWVVFERRDKGLWGDLRIFPDTRLESAPEFHSAEFRLPVERVMAEGALLEPETRSCAHP